MFSEWLYGQMDLIGSEKAAVKLHKSWKLKIWAHKTKYKYWHSWAIAETTRIL